MKLGDFLMQNKYVLPEKGKVELFKGNDRILVTGPSSIDTLIELFGQYNLLKIVFLTENCFQMCIEKVLPYTVRVMVVNLKIRKGPGTNYAKVGLVEPGGVYTIVSEAMGKGAAMWGKLESGAGWISLDYCRKV